MVEYGLILACIALTCFAAFGQIGTNLNVTLNTIAGGVTTAGSLGGVILPNAGTTTTVGVTGISGTNGGLTGNNVSGNGVLGSSAGPLGMPGASGSQAGGL